MLKKNNRVDGICQRRGTCTYVFIFFRFCVIDWLSSGWKLITAWRRFLRDVATFGVSFINYLTDLQLKSIKLNIKRGKFTFCGIQMDVKIH